MMIKLVLLLLLGLGVLSTCNLQATPTSLLWTNCTTEILDTGTANIDLDVYFTVFNRRGHGQYFPPLTGLQVGFFSYKDLKFEGGFDFLGGTNDPLFFNAKCGMAQDKLFPHAPALNIGIFDVGTRTKGPNPTNLNIVDLILGRDLPAWLGGGTLYMAGFAGGKALGKDRYGFMLGYSHYFLAAKDEKGKEYHKWEIEMDYASGNNVIGGGSLAIAYYFTPNISLETGPAFFNTARYNGKWKWSVQLDLAFEAFDPKNVKI